MKARCAAWFRLVLSQPRVVQAFVVLARFRSMLRAYQGDSKARYAAWFRVVFSQPCVVRRLVMLNWFRSAWFGQAQLLVSSHRGRHMPELGCLSTLAPNTRLQRTPLRVVRDRAFFIACICYNVSAINRGGAAKAQPVGRHVSSIRTHHILLVWYNLICFPLAVSLAHEVYHLWDTRLFKAMQIPWLILSR